jgi:flagellar biosynthesis protein FliP
LCRICTWCCMCDFTCTFDWNAEEEDVQLTSILSSQGGHLGDMTFPMTMFTRGKQLRRQMKMKMSLRLYLTITDNKTNSDLLYIVATHITSPVCVSYCGGIITLIVFVVLDLVMFQIHIQFQIFFPHCGRVAHTALLFVALVKPHKTGLLPDRFFFSRRSAIFHTDLAE